MLHRSGHILIPQRNAVAGSEHTDWKGSSEREIIKSSVAALHLHINCSMFGMSSLLWL